MKIPTGDELRKELEKRNISTVGLPANANNMPLESAMQNVLAECWRDERDEQLLAATTSLAGFTKKLVHATWMVGLATIGLVIATVALIVVTYLHAK